MPWRGLLGIWGRDGWHPSTVGPQGAEGAECSTPGWQGLSAERHAPHFVSQTWCVWRQELRNPSPTLTHSAHLSLLLKDEKRVVWGKGRAAPPLPHPFPVSGPDPLSWSRGPQTGWATGFGATRRCPLLPSVCPLSPNYSHPSYRTEQHSDLGPCVSEGQGFLEPYSCPGTKVQML